MLLFHSRFNIVDSFCYGFLLYSMKTIRRIFTNYSVFFKNNMEMVWPTGNHIHVLLSNSLSKDSHKRRLYDVSGNTHVVSLKFASPVLA